jgi:predicted RNA binding protein YcfA (HicA-like mRNA interferase family)
MTSTNSKDIIKVLKRKGWELKNTVGSHNHFVHPELKGKVTVPHPKKDIGQKTFKSILKQMNMSYEEFMESL